MAKSIIYMLAAVLSCLPGEELLPSLTQIPDEDSNVFREIGSYQVTKSVIIKLGQITEVNKGEMVLRVFTDGIDIRISPEDKDDDYLAFQIYRSEGIYDSARGNLSPGVQAFSDQGEIVRHLVIDAKLMTLTKFPTSSSEVEIIYATRYER